MAVKTWFCVVSLLAIIYWTEACDVGWFGLNCQYKCRCSGNSCNKNGTCVNGANCLGGWFGPACQFDDIAYLKGWDRENTDGDDNTCGQENGHNYVNVVLGKEYSIGWVRVRVRRSAAANLLKAEFVYLVEHQILYPVVTKIRVDEITLDFIVENKSIQRYFNEVRVVGLTSHDVCSINISGGRNVALKQTTSQSSTYTENSISYTSDKAVDGNTNPDFLAAHTCSQTAANQPLANWSVTFSQPKIINRFLLYNSNTFGERLGYFALQGYKADGTKSFEQNHAYLMYRPAYKVIKSVYNVTFSGLGHVTSRVDIKAGHKEHILTLCEVEIYGDSVCEDGRYGRDCEHRCNCAGGGTCFVSTGGCPSGCAQGYRGEACDQSIVIPR